MKKIILSAFMCLGVSAAMANAPAAQALVQCPNPADGTNAALLQSINDPNGLFEIPSYAQGMLKYIQNAKAVQFDATVMDDDGSGRIACLYTSSVGLLGIELREKFAKALIITPTNNSNGSPPSVCGSTNVIDCQIETNVN